MPKRILLADDSITIQKVVELTFSDGDYEVIATNNGAKAIQRLAEVKPDIVLSDIIMPEKNGYEVCEYVKSHPEFRHIPVILLTGTFEPFDPDRAEKAGCDAVVTKPFESQSLIHKVEELIQQSRNRAAPPPMFEPAQSVGTMPTEGVFADQTFGEQSFGEQAFDEPPASQVPVWPPLTPVSSASNESLDDSPFAPEPKAPASGLSDDDSDPFAPSAGKRFSPEPSFRSHGDELFAPEPKSPAGSSMPFEKPQDTSSRFGSEQSDSFGNEDSKGFSAETRAFPKMSYEDMKKLRDESLSPPPPAAASSSVSTGSSPAWPEPDLSDEAPTGRWPAPAASGRPSTASPFDDSSSSATAAPSPRSTPTPAEKPAAQPFSFDEDAGSATPAGGTEQSPFAPSGSFASEPLWAPPSSQQSAPPKPAAPASAPTLPERPVTSPSLSAPAASTGSSSPTSTAPKSAESLPSKTEGDLTEAQIDKIARRVIELMSDQVVKNIAWEVIPDLAEIVVRERIKELEQETN